MTKFSHFHNLVRFGQNTHVYFKSEVRVEIIVAKKKSCADFESSWSLDFKTVPFFQNRTIFNHSTMNCTWKMPLKKLPQIMNCHAFFQKWSIFDLKTWFLYQVPYMVGKLWSRPFRWCNLFFPIFTKLGEIREFVTHTRI